MSGSTELFEQHRSRLLRAAYRMLGSVAEAEELVQDAYLRWRRVDADDVRSPGAFLVTTVSRLALDRLRSLEAERERYPGPWLPEPVVIGEGSRSASRAFDPAGEGGRLDTAFLHMLQRLTPDQRVAYLLREAFDFEYEEIADVLDSTEAACRQHVSRARRRLRDGEVRYEASPEEAEELRRAFAEATLEGDLEGLVSVLADDVTHWSDGGGDVPAAREPVRGAENVARLLVGVVEGEEQTVRLEPVEVNGEPGLLAHVGDRPASVVSFAVEAGEIARVYQVLSPAKLRRVLGPRAAGPNAKRET